MLRHKVPFAPTSPPPSRGAMTVCNRIDEDSEKAREDGFASLPSRPLPETVITSLLPTAPNFWGVSLKRQSWSDIGHGQQDLSPSPDSSALTSPLASPVVEPAELAEESLATQRQVEACQSQVREWRQHQKTLVRKGAMTRERMSGTFGSVTSSGTTSKSNTSSLESKDSATQSLGACSSGLSSEESEYSERCSVESRSTKAWSPVSLSSKEKFEFIKARVPGTVSNRIRAFGRRKGSDNSDEVGPVGFLSRCHHRPSESSDRKKTSVSFRQTLTPSAGHSKRPENHSNMLSRQRSKSFSGSSENRTQISTRLKSNHGLESQSQDCIPTMPLSPSLSNLVVGQTGDQMASTHISRISRFKNFVNSKLKDKRKSTMKSGVSSNTDSNPSSARSSFTDSIPGDMAGHEESHQTEVVQKRRSSSFDRPLLKPPRVPPVTSVSLPVSRSGSNESKKSCGAIERQTSRESDPFRCNVSRNKISLDLDTPLYGTRPRSRATRSPRPVLSSAYPRSSCSSMESGEVSEKGSGNSLCSSESVPRGSTPPWPTQRDADALECYMSSRTKAFVNRKYSSVPSFSAHPKEDNGRLGRSSLSSLQFHVPILEMVAPVQSQGTTTLATTPLRPQNDTLQEEDCVTPEESPKEHCRRSVLSSEGDCTTPVGQQKEGRQRSVSDCERTCTLSVETPRVGRQRSASTCELTGNGKFCETRLNIPVSRSNHDAEGSSGLRLVPTQEADGNGTVTDNLVPHASDFWGVNLRRSGRIPGGESPSTSVASSCSEGVTTSEKHKPFLLSPRSSCDSSQSDYDSDVGNETGLIKKRSVYEIRMEEWRERERRSSSVVSCKQSCESIHKAENAQLQGNLLDPGAVSLTSTTITVEATAGNSSPITIPRRLLMSSVEGSPPDSTTPPSPGLAPVTFRNSFTSLSAGFGGTVSDISIVKSTSSFSLSEKSDPEANGKNVSKVKARLKSLIAPTWGSRQKLDGLPKSQSNVDGLLRTHSNVDVLPKGHSNIEGLPRSLPNVDSLPKSRSNVDTTHTSRGPKPRQTRSSSTYATGVPGESSCYYLLRRTSSTSELISGMQFPPLRSHSISSGAAIGIRRVSSLSDIRDFKEASTVTPPVIVECCRGTSVSADYSIPELCSTSPTDRGCQVETGLPRAQTHAEARQRMGFSMYPSVVPEKDKQYTHVPKKNKKGLILETRKIAKAIHASLSHASRHEKPSHANNEAHKTTSNEDSSGHWAQSPPWNSQGMLHRCSTEDFSANPSKRPPLPAPRPTAANNSTPPPVTITKFRAAAARAVLKLHHMVDEVLECPSDESLDKEESSSSSPSPLCSLQALTTRPEPKDLPPIDEEKLFDSLNSLSSVSSTGKKGLTRVDTKASLASYIDFREATKFLNRNTSCDLAGIAEWISRPGADQPASISLASPDEEEEPQYLKLITDDDVAYIENSDGTLTAIGMASPTLN